jgi:hypothetical protein
MLAAFGSRYTLPNHLKPHLQQNPKPAPSQCHRRGRPVSPAIERVLYCEHLCRRQGNSYSVSLPPGSRSGPSTRTDSVTKLCEDRRPEGTGGSVSPPFLRGRTGGEGTRRGSPGDCEEGGAAIVSRSAPAISQRAISTNRVMPHRRCMLADRRKTIPACEHGGRRSEFDASQRT